MKWSITCLFLAGSIIAVNGDIIGPLSFAQEASLFRYADDLNEDYNLREDEELFCFSPFWEIGGRCLFVNIDDDWLDWGSAQKVCEAINGNLIEIDPEEQASLSEYLVNTTGGWNIYGAFWTGGTDKQNESEWLWLSGNPVLGDFGDDINNNITGVDENCLMLAAKEAVYKDQRCDNKWGYLCEPGPCYNDTCGTHAHCEVLDYVTSECACNVGYEGDADTECTPIDPCDKDPCGAHAECIREAWNRFHCECDEGYTGKPPSLPCEYDPCFNITCESHAHCVELDSTTAECQCEDGYEGDPTQGCSLPDPCKDITCGEHASCHADGSNGVCRCDEGYSSGDPYVKCSGVQKYASMFLLGLCLAILFGEQTKH